MENILHLIIFRCNIILYPRCTWFVSYNWHYGIYDKETICSKKTKMMPWMNLTSDILWWCGGNELLGFTRDPTGARAFRDPRFMYIDNDCYYTELYANDISKFVPWKNFIICGHTYIYIYLANHICTIFYFCHIILCKKKTLQRWNYKLLFAEELQKHMSYCKDGSKQSFLRYCYRCYIGKSYFGFRRWYNTGRA